MGWQFETRDLTEAQDNILLDYIKSNGCLDIDDIIIKFEKDFNCDITKMYICKLILNDAENNKG